MGFCIGNRQEAYDAEIFAIMRRIRFLASKKQSGQGFTVFADSQAAKVRIQSDASGPGQVMATEIIEVASKSMIRAIL